MPGNDNCAQEGRPAAPEGANSDTYSMIWNAKSLQSVVKKLEWNEAESPQSDSFLFRGTTLAEAILLSLATEIALKTLLFLEQKKDPPHIHGLNFCGLTGMLTHTGGLSTKNKWGCFEPLNSTEL